MPPPSGSYSTRARGKLLLTGEYFVLDGAQALAVPVKFGQQLRVEQDGIKSLLGWKSLEADGSTWFEAVFTLPDLNVLEASELETARTLRLILLACQRQRPEAFSSDLALQITTKNDFPREWGLGTSSTLIAALARWCQADPYPVLFDTLGGSGYDIACAYAGGPLLYRLIQQQPHVHPMDHLPAFFASSLYFVFLGKKQNSREGIAKYRALGPQKPELIAEATRLTERFLASASHGELASAMAAHERFIGHNLGLPLVQDVFFPDFWGAVKSLGAWGGDFVLVASNRPETETRDYFRQKGFEVFFPWQEMAL